MLSEGECGKAEGERVEQIEGPCPAVVDPVCALEKATVACITEPCPTHEYKTFGNSCEASQAVADIAFEQECGALEGILTEGQPPVTVSESLPAVDQNLSVAEAVLEGDLLHVSLGYSGCSEQHIELHISSAFRESLPVQAAYAFVQQVQEPCDAAFQTRFVYDLKPLKHAYQQAYQSEHGEIALPALGTYRF